MSTAVEVPRAGVEVLRGEVERQAREVCVQVLAEVDRDGQAPIGSTSGPDQPFWFDYGPRGVMVRVFTDAAIASQERWHTYWRANSDHRGAYRTHDPEVRAAAPPEPTSDVAFAVHLTWVQVRDWLTEPAQLDLLSVLEDPT